MNITLSSRGRAVWGPVAKQRNEFTKRLCTLICSCMTELDITELQLDKEGIYRPTVILQGMKTQAIKIEYHAECGKAFCLLDNGEYCPVEDISLDRLLAILKILTLKL